MIAYITIGVNDISRAEDFYTAFLPALGYQLERKPDGIACALPPVPGQTAGPPELYVKSPFDGGAASAGNGTMLAFQASSREQVRALHAAALAAGGSDEGQPGFRDAYGPHFYVGYLRDPQGNKIALFYSSRNEAG